MALPGFFDFAVRYTKGEEKVCVLDCNPWLAKMSEDKTYKALIHLILVLKIKPVSVFRIKLSSLFLIY